MPPFDWPSLRREIEAKGRRPLFATISGAHLYGFDSPDSDIDVRGCHAAPLRECIGLDWLDETIARDVIQGAAEIDLVSHEAGKYLNLLTRNNGYILEQIFSPLVVEGAAFLGELRSLAARCVTRHHYHHYRGFYQTQRKLLAKQEPKTAKALLYAYRVLLTGIHLLETGEVEANLRRLNERRQLPFIDELIARKIEEHAGLPDLDWAFHETQLDRLESHMTEAFERSTLPEERDRAAVNEFLIALRLGGQ